MKKVCEKCQREIDKFSFEKHYRVCPTKEQKDKIISLYQSGKSIREIVEIGFVCSMIKASIKGIARGKSKSKQCAAKFSLCQFCNKSFDNQNFKKHVKHCEEESKFKDEILSLYKSWKSREEIVKLGYKQSVVKNVLKLNKRCRENNGKNPNKRRPHTDEQNKAQSARMIESNRLGTTKRWNIHWKRKKSYAEQEIYNFFIRKELKEHDDFFCEFPFNRYHADFYFPKLKLVIEVDSEIHETDPNRKASDARKDALINSLGIDVMRLKWKNHCQNRSSSYAELGKIIFERDRSPVIVESYNKRQLAHFIMNDEHKIKIKKEKKRVEKVIKLKKTDGIKTKINLILTSDVDFSKFGWVGEISKIINILPQHINEWMNKNMKEFYNNFCYKRGSGGICGLKRLEKKSEHELLLNQQRLQLEALDICPSDRGWTVIISKILNKKRISSNLQKYIHENFPDIYEKMMFRESNSQKIK